MNVFLPWLLGAIILILLIAVFLWPGLRARYQRKPIAKLETPEFKYEVAAELSPRIPQQAARKDSIPELPGSYGIDRLVLMVRDPSWLYAYWEITATKQDEFNAAYGNAAWNSTRPVLRVYDVTGINFNGTNANSYIDINLPEFTDNWNLNVGQPDRSFCVDLGRVFPDGRFITLLRSNVVTTPRCSLSDCLDEEWMWIEGIYKTIRHQMGISSPIIIEELNERMGALPLGISSPGFKEKEIH